MTRSVVTPKQNKRYKLEARQSMTARCDGLVSWTDYKLPFHSAEYALHLTYRALPWPVKQTRVNSFEGIIDPSGRIVKWVAK